MSHKYGDAVVLVLKSVNPSTQEASINRVNAIVLGSFVQPDGAEKFSPKEVEAKRALKGPDGKAFPGGEYLDLVYPNPGLVPPGSTVSTRDPSIIFQHTYHTAPFKEGAFIGWEAVPAPPSPDAKKLRDFLFANFKSETGNETPEACAIRLLSKRVKADKDK